MHEPTKRKDRGDLTVGDLRKIFEGMPDDVEVRITVDEPTTYVQLVKSRFEGDRPYSQTSVRGAPGQPLRRKGITLYGREAWNADLKPSECHVQSEAELQSLRA